VEPVPRSITVAMFVGLILCCQGAYGGGKNAVIESLSRPSYFVPQDDATNGVSSGQGSQLPSAEKPKCGGSGPEILDNISDKDELELVKKEIVIPLFRRIRSAWISLIPIEARPPSSLPGATTISFTIGADGKLQKMNLVNVWGRAPIARGAWGAITSTRPDPFPSNIHRQSLTLQLEFTVNIHPCSE
jgi:hypothetical protein